MAFLYIYGMKRGFALFIPYIRQNILKHQIRRLVRCIFDILRVSNYLIIGTKRPDSWMVFSRIFIPQIYLPKSLSYEPVLRFAIYNNFPEFNMPLPHLQELSTHEVFTHSHSHNDNRLLHPSVLSTKWIIIVNGGLGQIEIAISAALFYPQIYQNTMYQIRLKCF